MFLADDLVLSAKKRGSIPTSQVTFSEEDFLRIADEEMQGYLVPFLQSIREDYYVVEADLPFASSLRVPSRAVGGALREVVFLDSSGNKIDPPRFSHDDIYGEEHGRGFKLLGNTIHYVGSGASPTTVRLSYYQRPGRLVRAAECARVTGVIGNAVLLGAIPPPPTPLTPPSTTAPTSFVGVTGFWDVVKGTPGYEHVKVDHYGTVVNAPPYGVQLTFSSVAGIEAGDYVALAGYSPVVQAPVECHHLLAQRVAAKCLETLGFDGEMNAALAILKRMETDAKVLLTPRVQGAPVKVVPRNPLWRRR